MIFPFDVPSFQLPGDFTFSGEKLAITLDFLSPTSFKDRSSGKIHNKLEFAAFIRSLLRRFSAMSAMENDSPPLIKEAPMLAEKAGDVKIVDRKTRPVFWERFSTRQDQRATWGGLVGQVTYEGDLRPFIPLLQIGEVLHVGRGTTFGQGSYKILSVSSTGH